VQEKTTTKLLDRLETTWEFYNFTYKESVASACSYHQFRVEHEISLVVLTEE